MSTEQHDEPNADVSAYREELVAYLDGELEGEGDRLRIENLLASNPAIRSEVQRLEQTWDLLDELPRATVDESFASSTSEMIAISASQDLERQEAEIPRRRQMRLIGSIAGVAVAILIGFVGMRLMLPDPNASLLADLPILENLDAYRQAGSLEFLRMLNTDRLIPAIADAPSQSTKLPSVATETAADRRQRVVKLTATDKDQLNRKERRFFDLPLDEQTQLRALHAAIEQHPQRDELYRTMFAYYDWLKTLTSGEPTDLHHMDPNERIAKIKEIEGKRLSDQDRQGVNAWVWDLVLSRKLDQRFRPPPDDSRSGGNMSDEQRQRFASFWLLQQFDSNSKEVPRPKKPEIALLKAKLTFPRWDYLASLKLPEQQSLVEDWMRYAAWRPHSRPSFSDDEVRKQLAELSEEQRSNLLKRPQHEIQRYLRDRAEGRFGGPGGGPGGGKGGPDGPRGGRMRPPPDFSPDFRGPPRPRDRDDDHGPRGDRDHGPGPDRDGDRPDRD